MNPTLPPGLSLNLPLHLGRNILDATILARRVCHVPWFRDNRGVFGLQIGDFVDATIAEIKRKPDSKTNPDQRIRERFEFLLKIIQYYVTLSLSDDPQDQELATLLYQALTDTRSQLPGEAEIKWMHPNGNGLTA